MVVNCLLAAEACAQRIAQVTYGPSSPTRFVLLCCGLRPQTCCSVRHVIRGKKKQCLLRLP